MINYKKIILFYLFLISGIFFCNSSKDISPFCLMAEKDVEYDSSDEFLPADINEERGAETVDQLLAENNDLVKNASLKGIKFLKEERKIVFSIGASDPDDIEGKDLWYDVKSLNFPPRIVLHLFGVSTDEKIFKFLTWKLLDLF